MRSTKLQAPSSKLQITSKIQTEVYRDTHGTKERVNRHRIGIWSSEIHWVFGAWALELAQPTALRTFNSASNSFAMSRSGTMFGPSLKA